MSIPDSRQHDQREKSGVIRWGIIGCGDVVERKSGTSFQDATRSNLVAVMRRTESLVEDFARKNDVPFWTTDAKELINHPDVDAVYIATPPSHHLDYALQVCRAGKPCLIEKPVGRSAVECQQISDAFAGQGIPWFASYYRRYLPKYVQVKEFLDSGQIGPVVAVHYRYSRPPLGGGNWKMSPEVSGGGSFFDVGGHVLDLLDYWFGPIEFTGGGAMNVLPSHEVEDAVSISFRGAEGMVGTGLWNFAAPRTEEYIEIEGMWGRVRLECMECWSPLVTEVSAARLGRKPGTPLERKIRKLRGKKARKWDRTEHRFTPIAYVQLPMIQAVVDALLDGVPSRQAGDAALRTSKVMDAALREYYSGRHDAFWERPDTWHSIRNRALRQEKAPATGETEQYRLPEEDLRFFEESGYLGPFRCDAPEWKHIMVPAKSDRLNLHLQDPELFRLCSHPCIIERVDQALGGGGVSLMKTRIWRKPPNSDSKIPWHQDAGLHNGGFRPDGSAAPSVTVWFSLDGASSEKGAVKVIPGSHHSLIGNVAKGLYSDLEVKGYLEGVDLNAAVELPAEAGEFYLFHSWILHGSESNVSQMRRTGLNMRFVQTGDEVDPDFEYIALKKKENHPSESHDTQANRRSDRCETPVRTTS